MTLDWEYLVSLESGDTPVPLSSPHAICLLALIARQQVNDLDALTEDEGDAGSNMGC